MLKEYQTSKYTLSNPDDEKWEAIITIDLRYVTAAEIWAMDPRFTAVTLMGGRGVPIRETYEDFLRDWHSVKR